MLGSFGTCSHGARCHIGIWTSKRGGRVAKEAMVHGPSSMYLPATHDSARRVPTTLSVLTANVVLSFQRPMRLQRREGDLEISRETELLGEKPRIAVLLVYVHQICLRITIKLVEWSRKVQQLGLFTYFAALSYMSLSEKIRIPGAVFQMLPTP